MESGGALEQGDGDAIGVDDRDVGLDLDGPLHDTPAILRVGQITEVADQAPPAARGLQLWVLLRPSPSPAPDAVSSLQGEVDRRQASAGLAGCHFFTVPRCQVRSCTVSDLKLPLSPNRATTPPSGIEVPSTSSLTEWFWD